MAILVKAPELITYMHRLHYGPQHLNDFRPCIMNAVCKSIKECVKAGNLICEMGFFQRNITHIHS